MVVILITLELGILELELLMTIIIELLNRVVVLGSPQIIRAAALEVVIMEVIGVAAPVVVMVQKV